MIITCANSLIRLISPEKISYIGRLEAGMCVRSPGATVIAFSRGYIRCLAVGGDGLSCGGVGGVSGGGDIAGVYTFLPGGGAYCDDDDGGGTFVCDCIGGGAY